MKKLFYLALILLAFGCNNAPSTGYITVKVEEVIQVETYTYLLVKAKGPAYWVAVPTTNAKAGESYQYLGGLKMEGFYSKELDRTFEEILFLEDLISDSSIPVKENIGATQGSKTPIEKSDVSIEATEGAISIADLFSNMELYNGKKVRVSGEVTKFNPEIMERNWVHLQDGSEFEGKFDLTATSSESFVVGQTVTIEGVLAINMDFGYGYRYELLLEQASIVE